MNRNEWTFEYTGAALLKAARAKLAHHVKRKKWWADKKEEVIAKIKSEGVEINESIVDELSKGGYSNVFFRQPGGPNVALNNQMVEHLRECAGKVDQHEASVKTYEGWVAVLGAHPKKKLPLHHDDYLFFFGK